MRREDSLLAKQCELLAEVDKICRKNGIEYYAMEELLVTAIRKKELPVRRKAFSIAIYAKDVKPFIKAVRKKKRRGIESLLNNPDFPGYYLRYYDKNTVLYDARKEIQPYKNCCIGMNIYVICSPQKKGMLDGLRSAWALKVGNDSNFRFRHLISQVLKNSKAFNRMMSNHKDNTDEVFIYTDNGRQLKFSRDSFGKPVQVRVAGIRVKLPQKKNLVGKATNGSLLITYKQESKRVVDSMFIISTSIPWKEFSARISSKGFIDKKNVKLINKYLDWKNNKFNSIWDMRKKYYEFYFLTKDRFLYYDRLCGEIKIEIMEFFKARDFERLNKVLRGYMSRLRYHNARGYGLFMDQDLFKVAICTMTWQEMNNEKIRSIRKRKVNRLREYADKIPVEYFRPIEAETEEYTSDMLRQMKEGFVAEINEGISIIINEWEETTKQSRKKDDGTTG